MKQLLQKDMRYGYKNRIRFYVVVNVKEETSWIMLN
jgi:hypothetical protein